MAISLADLLQAAATQQQQPVQQQPQPDAPSDAFQEIPVTGHRSKPTDQPDPTGVPLNIGMGSVISPQDMYNLQNPEGLPQHTGMFGTRGTLRDVLGTIGDALLMQGGHQAVYRPQRQQEQIADAMVGFNSTNPDVQRAAIARVGLRNHELAHKLQQDMDQDAMRKQQIQAMSEYRNSQKAAVGEKMISNALGYLSSPSIPDDKKAEVYKAMHPRLINIAKRYGVIDPNDDGEDYLPSDYNNMAMAAVGAEGYNTKDRIANDLRQQSVNIRGKHYQNQDEVAKQNADTNRARVGAILANGRLSYQAKMAAVAATLKGQGLRHDEAAVKAAIDEQRIGAQYPWATGQPNSSMAVPTTNSQQAPTANFSQYEGKTIRQGGHTYKVTGGKPVLIQ